MGLGFFKSIVTTLQWARWLSTLIALPYIDWQFVPDPPKTVATLPVSLALRLWGSQTLRSL
jgi:hypothetical protein